MRSVFQTQLEYIQKIVSQGEGQQVEFKRRATFPEKVVREMVAFANSQGGKVLIGVNDDGVISGLKDPEEESFVLQKALQLCRPGLNLTEKRIPISEKKSVILYDVPESQKKPHALIHSETRKKETFIRVGDQSLRASREVREILKRSPKKKDIKFHYGENEAFLVKYLDQHEFITLKDFSRMRKLNKFHASKKLILLVLADVLQISPHERGDQFSLAYK